MTTNTFAETTLTITETRTERIKRKKKENRFQFVTSFVDTFSAFASKFFNGTLLKTAFSFIAAIIIFASFSNVIQACDDTHIVVKGDSLSKISQDYKVTVKQLKEVNGLQSDNISIGKELIVPLLDSKGNHATHGEPLTKGEVIHTIQKGESLWSISKKYSVSVESIMNYNHLESANLIPGRLLAILTVKTPAPKAVSKPVVQLVSKPTVATSTYKAFAGDTLYGLSTRFNMTVDEFRKLNNLKSDGILIGQKLKVPALVSKTVKVTVLGANDPHTFYVLSNGQEHAFQTNDAVKLSNKFKEGTRATVTYEIRNGYDFVLKSIN